MNSKLAIKKELEQTTASILEVPVKQGPEGLTAAICKSFVSKNWGKEEPVSDKQTHEQRFDLFKDRVAVEIEFSRYEFLYRD